MKRNIPEFKYIDAWQILCREGLNGTIVDDKSLEIMLRIEKSMSRLEVMGDDERKGMAYKEYTDVSYDEYD